MSVSVENIMALPIMRDARLVSGTGLSNKVQYVTVAEAPNIRFPNYNEGIFVLTTLSAYHESTEKINMLVEGLCAVNVAAIGIKLGRFVDRIDPQTVAVAEKSSFPERSSSSSDGVSGRLSTPTSFGRTAALRTSIRWKLSIIWCIQ